MQIKSGQYRGYSLRILLILISSCFAMSIGLIEVATAREIGKSEPSIPQNSISQTPPSQPTKPRLRVPFFEQERKPRFGFGDFLQSALDGSDNYFAADYSLPSSPPAIPGTLTIVSRNRNSINFLTTTFVAPGVNLGFANPSYGSDPRIGTITFTDNLGTVIPNGARNYSGSFSNNGDRVSGAIQVVDPNNPSTTILIQVPPTVIPNVGNDNQPISAPATLTIGLPTDR